MDEMITSRYEMTADDWLVLVAAQRQMLLRRSLILRAGWWTFLGLTILLTTLLVGAIAIASPRDRAGLRSAYVMMAGLVACLWLGAYLLSSVNILDRSILLRKFRGVPEGARRIEWGFDDAGLWCRTDLAESTFRWELFGTIAECPGCFLFYQGDVFALGLPGRGFSSPGMLRSFTELARARVPHYVVLGACRSPAKPDPIGLDEL